MPIPKNKLELLHAIEDTYQKLQLDLQRVPIQDASIKNLEGHAKDTMMSPCDLVAYLIGWGELVLKWNRLKNKEETIDFPETGFKWNELGLLAQKFYQDYEEDDFPTLLKKLESIFQKITQLIESLDDHQLYQTPFYEKYPLGRMIQLNTSSPYKNARSRIRKWIKQNGIT